MIEGELCMRSAKKCLIFVSIIVTLLLSACGNKDMPKEVTEKDTIESLENSTENESVVQEETEIASVSQPISLNETITMENAAFAITKTKISNTIEDSTLQINLDDEEDSLWFCAWVTMKNIGKEEIDILEGLYANLILDEEYSYPVDFVGNKTKLVPLSSTDFIMKTAIPNDALSLCNDYCLSFGFSDDFKTAKEQDDISTIYELKGTLDEFASADSIDSFTSLIEYTAQYLVNNGFDNVSMEAYDVSENLQVIELSTGEIGVVTMDDGTAFSINPCLEVLYDSFLFEVHGLQSKIRFNLEVRENPIPHYYSSAEHLLSINSSGGVAKSDSIALGAYNKQKKAPRVSFSFSSLESDDIEATFDTVYDVFEGDDVVISFEFIGSEDSTFVEYLCEDSIKESVIELMQAYSGMPRADWNAVQ